MSTNIDWSKYYDSNTSVPEEKTIDWSQYYDNQEPPMPEKTGFSGVGSDIWEGVKRVPGNIVNIATQLPGEVYGAAQQIDSDLPRVAQNVVAGAANLGHGLLNTPANITDYLARKEILPKHYEGMVPRQEEHNFAEMLGREGHKPGDTLFEQVAELPGYIAGGELGALSKLGRAGARATALGAHAIGQNRNPVEEILTVGAIPSIGYGAYKGGPKLAKAAGRVPANVASRFGPNLSVSELQNAQRVARGTQTPLGDVIQSPFLKKKFENQIAPILGSGAEEVFKGISEDIKGKGTNLVEGLGGENALADPNILVKKMLDTAFKNERKIKNEKYKKVNDLAKQENFGLNLQGFKSLAKKNAKTIKNSSLLMSDSKLRNTYKKLLKFEEPGNATMADANMLSSTLYTEGSKMLGSQSAADRHIGNLYKKLSVKLRNDVKHSLHKTGSENLRTLAEEAKGNYKDKFARFLDRDINKMLNEGKDAQAIVHEIIQPSKTLDKYTRIEKIKSILPEDQQNILGYSYLRQAMDNEGNLIPSKLAHLVNNLGKRQFKTLFDPETQQALLDYQKLTKMNSEALSDMVNAKTGQRNVQALNSIVSGLSGSTGGILGGIPGAAIGLAAPPIAANWLTKKLTSEPFRNEVIRQKIMRQTEK